MLQYTTQRKQIFLVLSLSRVEGLLLSHVDGSSNLYEHCVTDCYKLYIMDRHFENSLHG